MGNSGSDDALDSALVKSEDTAMPDGNADDCKTYQEQYGEDKYLYSRDIELEPVKGSESDPALGPLHVKDLADKLASGEWSRVVLEGEIGVGKSTLVLELASLLCKKGMRPFVCDLFSNDMTAPPRGNVEPHEADSKQALTACGLAGRTPRVDVLVLDNVDRIGSDEYATVGKTAGALQEQFPELGILIVCGSFKRLKKGLRSPLPWRAYRMPPLRHEETGRYVQRKLGESAPRFWAWAGDVGLAGADCLLNREGLGGFDLGFECNKLPGRGWSTFCNRLIQGCVPSKHARRDRRS
jgi:hypothetical protein